MVNAIRHFKSGSGSGIDSCSGNIYAGREVGFIGMGEAGVALGAERGWDG
jgi:hypothetical protein